MAGVVFEKIIHMRVVERERFFRRVRIVAHAEERQRRDEVSLGGVEVHVFFVAVGRKEIVAHPSPRKRGQMRRVEVEPHFISRSEHGELVVGCSQQRQHVAVARIRAEGTRVGDKIRLRRDSRMESLRSRSSLSA